MTQPSGWYDDPQDHTQLRYWDGVVWSSHVSPKVSPTVEQSIIGMPYGVIPASARPQSAGSQGAQGPPAAPGGFGSPQQRQEQFGRGPQDYGPSDKGPQDQGQPGGGQWPAYGQGPGSLGGQQGGWQSNPATTPDGAPLSGWWLRVVARVLDAIFTSLLALPLTGWFYYHYLTGLLNWSHDQVAQTALGAAPVMAFPPISAYAYALVGQAIGLLVAAAYEVFFLRRSGATPGKRIFGISVRLRNVAGLMPMKAILLRTACYFAMSLISIAHLLDILWPLWDDKRQAIHDKVAETNVVVGSQPKRDA